MRNPVERFWFGIATLNWPKWKNEEKADRLRGFIHSKLGGCGKPEKWRRFALLGHDLKEPEEEVCVGWLVGIKPDYVLVEHVSDVEMWGFMKYAEGEYSSRPLNVSEKASTISFFSTNPSEISQWIPEVANRLRKFSQRDFPICLHWTQQDWRKPTPVKCDKNYVVKHHLGISRGRSDDMWRWLNKWLPHSDRELSGDYKRIHYDAPDLF